MNISIPVVEIFGPTIQGEGPQAGQKVLFIRTGGCDYDCSWCDTKHRHDSFKRMSLNEITSELNKLDPTGRLEVIVTGGNPMIHADELDRLFCAKYVDRLFSIETQGSLYHMGILEDNGRLNSLIVSPKPPSSGMENSFMDAEYFLNMLPCDFLDCYIKVPVGGKDDIEWTKKVYDLYREQGYNNPLFISIVNEDPLNLSTSPDQVSEGVLANYRKVIDLVLADETLTNVKVLPQLHTLVWGNKEKV